MTYEQRKEQVKSYLGKIVTVKIDRPAGSAHPRHQNIIYPINYGFLPNIIGGDEAELDVYVLGITEPLSEFTGKVIAIIHRENDSEDKLVAASDGMTFTRDEIENAVRFVEQYFISKIELPGDTPAPPVSFHSRADVPDGELKYAVIAARYNGKWIFCKHKERTTWEIPGGHREDGEDITNTAKRELFEETGALDFEIKPVCVYKFNKCGMLFFADVKTLGNIPDFSEIREINLFDNLPESLTYPAIQPFLYNRIINFIKMYNL